MDKDEKRGTRKRAVRVLQLYGHSRKEARGIVYGQGRNTVHETRGQALTRAVGENAARRRWKRRQQVASSIAVAEACA